MSDMTPTPLRATTYLGLGTLIGSAATPVHPRFKAVGSVDDGRSARALRAAAEAAGRAVEAGGTAAVDAALDVYEAELGTLRSRLDRQQEALRILALYASQGWARAVAAGALADAPLVDALPATLYDRELAACYACPAVPHA